MAVFESYDVLLALDDSSTEAVDGIFNNEITFGLDNRRLGTPLLDAGENVLRVAVHDWPRSLKMLTAREITRATVTSEIADCSMNIAFAHRESGSVSVGLNAVALVNEV